jgi:DNA-binding response OmpR family regulator
LRRQKKNTSELTGRLLWVDGKRAGNVSFIPGIRKRGLTIDIAATGQAALEQIKASTPDILIVDAGSMRTSGARICQSVREASPSLPIILIANAFIPVSEEAVASVILTQPFTIRKLLNRIVGLLPMESNSRMQAGPITLDTGRNIVRCADRESQLTPRLAELLEMLMESPGVVIEREKLFQKIWSTEYIGDTRTLDVHISWLRAAIESDPRKPQYLKTIRGVGYRLDV